jgi:hypothetical protein
VQARQVQEEQVTEWMDGRDFIAHQDHGRIYNRGDSAARRIGGFSTEPVVYHSDSRTYMSRIVSPPRPNLSMINCQNRSILADEID